MGTIVSVQKDFDADETDWDFGSAELHFMPKPYYILRLFPNCRETMAHSGYLYPMENQRILTSKQISIPYRFVFHTCRLALLIVTVLHTVATIRKTAEP